MAGEKSRFTSDRRGPRNASWASEADWVAGVAENVDIYDDSLAPQPQSVTTGETLDGLVFDFEEGTTENWSYSTTSASASDWGLKTVVAPDGGEYAIFLSQNSGGGNNAEIYSGPVAYNWAQSYEFEFLVKSDNFDPSDAWLGTSVGWRGRRNSQHSIGLSLHNTDPKGNLNPFTFRGGGVSNSTVYSVDWKPNTWYWVRGACNEADGMAQAKIWADGSGEPSSYQIQAAITTGISDGDVHVRVNGDDSTNLDSTFSHLKFG